MAERFEAALETRDAGEGAAPLQRVLRSGGESGDAQTLLTLESGLPLLEKGPRALGVVVTVEGLDAHVE